MFSQALIKEIGYLTEGEVRDFIHLGLNTLVLKDQRVLVLIPDGTRTMPLALLFEQLQASLSNVVAALDFLVALGTHPAMDDQQISRLLGATVRNGIIGQSQVYNHTWDSPETLREIGVISTSETAALTDGRMNQPIRVQVNRRIFEYDHILIAGPVFPHEVAGFSGGNKYLFPGISGPDTINLTHWLGALLTSYHVIGKAHTPVRAIIDRAASFINLPKSCFAFVVDKKGVAGVFMGSPEKAWADAVALSAERHIIKTGRYYKQVLAVLPDMYEDLWVGGKGMYKLEPVVEAGGELIIYAPHIRAISPTHGELIKSVGYHVLDYFLKRWEVYQDYPLGVLAHATHVKGVGTYDLNTGEEKPRITVTLATGISEDVCQSINLGYQDPNLINPVNWEGRQGEGVLVVYDAGEKLYRVQ